MASNMYGNGNGDDEDNDVLLVDDDDPSEIRDTLRSQFETLAANPEKFVDHLFGEYTNNGQNAMDKWEDELELQMTKIFDAVSADRLRKIPNLSLMTMEQLPAMNSQFVRFKCMVQEVYDPLMMQTFVEIKDKTSGDIRRECTMYKRGAKIDNHNEIEMPMPVGVKQKLRDVKNLHCISVPGEIDWNSNVSLTNPEALIPTSDVSQYREWMNKLPEDLSSQMTSFPLPSMRSDPFCKAVIAHVVQQRPYLLVNKVVELFGILTAELNPEELEAVLPDDNAITDTTTELIVRNPPTILVPRLTVLGYKISSKDGLPITELNLHEIVELCSLTSLEDARKARLLSLRQKLLDLLTDCFMGDRLCAQYVLINLVSSVEHRVSHGNVRLVGSLPLCILGIPKGHGEFIYNVLRSLEEKVAYIPNCFQSLMSQSWSPKKDYNSSKLKAGILQLSDGTHLIVEETIVTDQDKANLMQSQKGSENFTALQGLVDTQIVTYDFQFHPMSFQCHIPVLILTSSPRDTAIQGITKLPFDPAEVQRFENEIKPRIMDVLNDPKQMTDLREYINVCKGVSRTFDAATDDDTNTYIMSSFLESRKSENLLFRMDTVDFSRRFDICRNYIKCQGDFRLTTELWDKVNILEIERITRMSNLQK